MEDISLARFALSFLFVVGLIGLLALGLRRFGRSRQFMGGMEGDGRIKIIETRYIDPRRRLVLIRRDEMEHLLLLADGRELVIESRITDE